MESQISPSKVALYLIIVDRIIIFDIVHMGQIMLITFNSEYKFIVKRRNVFFSLIIMNSNKK